MEYPTAKIVKMFNVTHSRLHQLRMGYKRKYTRGKKKFDYIKPPELIEGKDWDFVRGDIVFKQSAVNKLKKIIKKPLK
jgi:hypothetical protein